MVRGASAAAPARRSRDGGADANEPVSEAAATVSPGTLLPVLVHDRRRAPANRTLVEPRAGRRVRAADHPRSVFAIACAATHADDQAHWKLKPPIRPSTSSISPIRYSPRQTRDCMVAGSISDSGTPPAVTSA